MNATFLFLGTGPSTGIPVIGCDCPVCSSHLTYNQRLRPSGLIKCSGRAILIDCGPDFRQQALRYQIHHLDALLITHTHYDHIAGIDELRAYFFQKKKPLDCLLSSESFEQLKKHYDYLFISNDGFAKPRLQFHLLKDDRGSVVIDEMKIEYFSFRQCQMKVTGFRLGSFAYISDIREFDESIFDALKGVRQLVISAISKTASRAHFSIAQATAFASRVGAEQTWLTHIGHQIDHEKTAQLLPPEIFMGYDGLEINIEL